MRTQKEIQERLRILTQAYHFSFAHHRELSDEARTKHRALEENIRLLQWCLEDPGPEEVTWRAVRGLFGTAFRLLVRKLVGRFGADAGSSAESDPPGAGRPREVTR